MDISDNEIYKTDSLSGKLKMCVGQELRMLTANINTSGSVKNGSTGKIEYMQMPRGIWKRCHFYLCKRSSKGYTDPDFKCLFKCKCLEENII